MATTFNSIMNCNEFPCRHIQANMEKKINKYYLQLNNAACTCLFYNYTFAVQPECYPHIVLFNDALTFFSCFFVMKETIMWTLAVLTSRVWFRSGTVRLVISLALTSSSSLFSPRSCGFFRQINFLVVLFGRGSVWFISWSKQSRLVWFFFICLLSLLINEKYQALCMIYLLTWPDLKIQ